MNGFKNWFLVESFDVSMINGFIDAFADTHELEDLYPLADYLEETGDPRWHETISVIRHAHLPIFYVRRTARADFYDQREPVERQQQRVVSLPRMVDMLDDTYWHANHTPITLEDTGYMQLTSDPHEASGQPYAITYEVDIRLRPGVVPATPAPSPNQINRTNEPYQYPMEPTPGFVRELPPMMPRIIAIALQLEHIG